MIYLRYQKESEDKAIVTFVHYKPLDEVDGLGMTKEELLQTGKLVESILPPEIREGMEARMYINPQTDVLWYEYVDAPAPIEDRIKQVEKVSVENKKANLDTQEAVLQLYEMVSQPQPK